MKTPEAISRCVELSGDCVCTGSSGSSVNFRWANNTTTTNGASSGASLSLAAIKDKRVGSNSVTYFDDASVAGFVAGAKRSAESRPAAPDFFELYQGDAEPGWDEDNESTSPEVLAQIVPGLQEVFDRAKSEDILTFGYASHSAGTRYLATSAGTRARHSRSSGSIVINAKTPDFKLSTRATKTTDDFGDVDVADMYEGLRRRIEWSQNWIAAEPGTYEVILEPNAISGLLYYLSFALSAREAAEGRSVFSRDNGGTALGEKLFASEVSLYSDPLEPGLESAPFVATTSSGSFSSLFDSGLPVPSTHWIRDGVLENLVAPRWWAAANGFEPHPYGGNLILAGNSTGPSLDQMIAETSRALLVSNFWYVRFVDQQTLLLTGLTRDGVFLVEDGKVKGAVNNFRFNHSPIKLLTDVLSIGPAERVNSSTMAPPLRVAGFNMSSVSRAT